MWSWVLGPLAIRPRMLQSWFQSVDSVWLARSDPGAADWKVQGVPELRGMARAWEFLGLVSGCWCVEWVLTRPTEGNGPRASDCLLLCGVGTKRPGDRSLSSVWLLTIPWLSSSCSPHCVFFFYIFSCTRLFLIFLINSWALNICNLIMPMRGGELRVFLLHHLHQGFLWLSHLHADYSQIHSCCSWLFSKFQSTVISCPPDISSHTSHISRSSCLNKIHPPPLQTCSRLGILCLGKRHYHPSTKCSRKQKKQASSLALPLYTVDLQVLSTVLHGCSSFCIPITPLLKQTTAVSHLDCCKATHYCPYSRSIFLQPTNSMNSNVNKMWQIGHFIYFSEYPNHFH